MKKVAAIYKPIGITPLDAVLNFKMQNPVYKNEKISYAGRLDPMAHGLLLLLIGEENKSRKDYEKLNKKYQFTILLGIETDTYDILGKVIKANSNNFSFKESQIKNLLNSFVGKSKQPYPPYSSKNVNGKPLYWWARNKRISEIEIPQRQIEIYNLKLKSIKKIAIQDLRFRIQEYISKVKGNFRQNEILKCWENFFNTTNIAELPLINCSIACSSGTYVRGIAHLIGQMLNTGALAFTIKRTAIGEYNISDII